MSVLHSKIKDLGPFKIALDLDDADISAQVDQTGWYSDEEFETAVFAKELHPGSRVLDLGGNIGFYTLLARSIVGPEGGVIVFEPYPRSAALIRASIESNAFQNVALVEAAVSDSVGRAKLCLSPDSCTEHSLLDLGFVLPGADGIFDADVQLVTVDDTLERLEQTSVDVVKMDIEGAEWRALQGMQRTLHRNPGIVLMTEFWPNGFLRAGTTAGRFLESLETNGFSFQEIDREAREVRPTTMGELLDLVERSARRCFEHNPVMRTWGWYTNLLCSRRRLV